MGFELFWNVPEGSDPFSDVLGCSEVSFGVIVNTERFWKVPESLEVFYDGLE